MAILFISCLVPDTPKFWNPAFTRSGQNVSRGIADALPKLESDIELVSCKPIPSFPKGPIYIKSEDVVLDNGQKVHLLPTINLLFLKNIIWGISAYFFILKWKKRYKKQNRNILVYNIYIPIISLLYRASKRSKSKLFAILYDLGVPPAHLKLGTLKMFGYRQFEKLAYKYIPKLSGRIVINEKIIDEYAPGKDYILIDGGVNNNVIDELFDLKESKSTTVTYVLAGMLWEQNGTLLLLDALKLRPDLNVKVIFAGRGNDVKLIEEAAAIDKRVIYKGMLSMQELVKVYEEADVLLNLRIEEDNDMHFPSKLFEYMVMGKKVISTPVAHAERDYGEYLDILHDITPAGLIKKMEIINALSKKELYCQGVKTRSFAVDNLSWDKRTKQIVEYINKCKS